MKAYHYNKKLIKKERQMFNIFKKLMPYALIVAMLFSVIGCVSDDDLITEDILDVAEKSITPAADTKLVVLHTNDTHARVNEGKYDGMGFAKILTLINEVRAENPNVLVLDAGDTFHGTTIASLVQGESIVQIMNMIGYDAMVSGNHDFNYGQERLVELAGMTDFPILAANVVKEDGSYLLAPYVIKDVNGLLVGIFGITTPETLYKSHPKNTEGLTFLDSIEVAKSMVDELRDKVHVIIALVHIGLDEETKVKSSDIAAAVDGIDLIVDGHSHTTLPEGMVVNNTVIVQTGNHDKNLGFVEITYSNGDVANIAASLITKDDSAEVSENSEILTLIGELEDKNKEVTDVVVGNTNVELDGVKEHVRSGPTNLGTLICEAMIAISDADVALQNGGGIRSSIDVGPITLGEIITVLPFGNTVVLLEVKGSVIKEAIENGIKSIPEISGAYSHVAGMTFSFDSSKEPGSRVTEILVGGKALNPDALYKLVTNDFLAAGGDEYSMLNGAKVLGEFGTLDEVLITYMNK